MSRWKSLVSGRIMNRWRLQQVCANEQEAVEIEKQWKSIIRDFEFKRVGNKIYERYKR